MRNAEVIVVISTKLAAHFAEISGQPVAPIANFGPNPRDSGRFLPYWHAIRAGAEAGTLDEASYAANLETLHKASNHLNQYVQESLTDPATVTAPDITNMDMDLPDGIHPTPEQWQAAAEDWEYGLIPARYLPDGEDGPRTDEGREAAYIAIWHAWAEKSLAEWARANSERDAIVRAAYAAGVPKTRIHLETGIARSTIDRILS